MWFAIVRPDDIDEDDILCKSKMACSSGTEVEAQVAKGGHTYRGVVLMCEWFPEDCEQMLRHLTEGRVGRITAQYFRSIVDWGDEDADGIDPLSLFPDDEELEAAAAGEVLGANE